MADLLAQSFRRAGDWSGAADKVVLDYEGRFLRRKRLQTEAGAALMVDLPETVSLNAGDAFAAVDGRFVEVVAADEPLIAVTGADLARLAWHIGNRHTPAQIEAGRILIRADHVMADMLTRLGATLAHVMAPFTPEGGAYGHGRTMGHGHDHGHAHGHGHGHRHD